MNNCSSKRKRQCWLERLVLNQHRTNSSMESSGGSGQTLWRMRLDADFISPTPTSSQNDLSNLILPGTWSDSWSSAHKTTFSVTLTSSKQVLKDSTSDRYLGCQNIQGESVLQGLIPLIRLWLWHTSSTAHRKVLTANFIRFAIHTCSYLVVIVYANVQCLASTFAVILLCEAFTKFQLWDLRFSSNLDQVWSALPALELLPLDCWRQQSRVSNSNAGKVDQTWSSSNHAWKQFLFWPY